MAGLPMTDTSPLPTIVALGDSSLLVRFGATLTDAASRAAISFALALRANPISDITEIVPHLVSVQVCYDARTASPAAIAGELRLRLSGARHDTLDTRAWTIPTTFDGPDLGEVAALLGMSDTAFVAAHNRAPLRVLATGFAPGFVYCGLHGASLVVPRRTSVRALVAAGSVLFAAGQTAIAATEMPTGWHVIGRTEFINFDPAASPPTRLGAGDVLTFEALQ